ncbi:MAG: hypothetical protein ACYSUK_05200 [Planctomycetota bacterium]|jgi:hypothetical protein
MMVLRSKNNSLIGWIAGVFVSRFGKGQTKPTVEDLKRAEFKASTQGMGVRFSDKIRNVFRFKWLKIRK